MRYFTLFSLLMLCYVSANCQAFKHFKKGYYFLESGQKVEGYIIPQPFMKEIIYRSDKGSKTERIKISKLKAVVTTEDNYDSLTVLSDDKGEKYLAKFLFASPITKFYYKYVRIVQTGAPVMSMGVASNPGARGTAPSFTNTMSWKSSTYTGTLPVLMYLEGSLTFEITKKNYTDVLIKALADSPKHVSQLKNKEVKYKNVEEFLESYSSAKELMKK